jgi:leucyl aminopeptidase
MNVIISAFWIEDTAIWSHVFIEKQAASLVLLGSVFFNLMELMLLLVQFVDEKVQWMHIDMAGPVWSDKKKAGTGFGVSTLVEWVLKNSS